MVVKVSGYLWVLWELISLLVAIGVKSVAFPPPLTLILNTFIIHTIPSPFITLSL